MLYGVTDAKPSKDMHHIHSIAKAPSLASEASNWLAVCGPCHEAIEGDEAQGMAVKRWSDAGYDEALHGASQDRGYQDV
jgi:cytochrome c553